jgi:hypothetical protein
MYTETDLGYLAGLFDGEGMVIANAQERNGSYLFNVRIKITNTNGKVIDWLQETFGGKVYISSRKKSFHKDRYDWTLSCSDGYEIIKQMLPYTIIKTEELELLLELYEYRGSKDPHVVQEKLRLVEEIAECKHEEVRRSC